LTVELTTEHRLTILEEAMRQVLVNHIPHIHEDIRDIKLWVRGIAVGALLAILGLILKEVLS